MDLQPERLIMTEPGTGRTVMVLARDRDDFERRGYRLADREPVLASLEDAALEPAPSLAVESRAFEQADRKGPRRRKGG